MNDFNNKKKSDLKDTHENYHTGLQTLLISYLMTDSECFALSQNIIQPEFFDAPLRPAARFILDYALEHNRTPTFEMLKGMTGASIEPFKDFGAHKEWYLKNIEGFCRYKALELTIIESVDLLEQGQGAEVERRVKEAVQISLTRDLGLDYFDNPIERLERLRDKSNFVSTGWKTLDDKLYGGFTRKALYLFAGGSGSGKSLWLQNLALNWTFQGLNVVYVTLELAEDLVAMRLDAMVSGFGTKEIFPNMKEVAYTIQKSRMENKGKLRLKKFPEAGTACNDLRAYVKEIEIKTGEKVDALIVDYLDLLHPNNKRIDPTNLFAKDKYVSEELRAMSFDLDCLLVSASQLNRQSVDAQEFDHSHIAGGISKINSCDALFGIFTTQAMRDRGVYQIQFLKTRSSAAVGQKIELAYDPASLRITDPEGTEETLRPKSTGELKQELADKKIKQAQVATSVSTPSENAPEASPRNDMMSLMKKIRNRNES